MKYFISLLTLFFISVQQKKSLKGIYKLEYENTSLHQTRTIVFDDSIYVIKTGVNLNQRGKINYGKTLTTMEGIFYPNIVINFDTKDIDKDTIIFQVHNKKGGVMNYLDASVNSGKLIKVNN